MKLLGRIVHINSILPRGATTPWASLMVGPMPFSAPQLISQLLTKFEVGS